MTKRDILSVAFKIMGVYFAANAITLVPVALGSLLYRQGMSSAQQNLRWYWAASVAWPVLPLLLAYVLLGFGDSIAGALVRGDDQPFSIGLAAGWDKALFSVSARITGLLLLARSIPSLARDMPHRLALTGYFAGGGLDLRALAVELIGPLVMIALGAYLLSGAKHLVRLLYSDAPPARPAAPSPNAQGETSPPQK